MYILSLKGDHYQMGLQHGQQVLDLRPLIVEDIDRRLQCLEQRGDLDSIVKELDSAWQRTAPATIAMLRGMAEALAIDTPRMCQYAAASYLDELAPVNPKAEGCTVWGASGPATHDGSPMVTKNRDCRVQLLHLQTLAYAAPREGYRYVSVTSAGSPAVSSSGINERGLTVADTHVPSRDIGPGLPRYALMMDLLEQHETVASALDYLRSTPQMGAGNLVLADAQGNLVVLESGYWRCGAILPVEHTVVATNHFMSGELRDDYVESSSGAYAESQARYQTVQAALKENRGAMDVGRAKTLMAKHAGATAAICRHDSIDDTSTISNAIFLPAERKLLFCHGRPCEGTYQAYSL